MRRNFTSGTPVQGQLIVTQTPVNQEKVVALLKELEALCAAEPVRH
jgi:hypothetical protein